MKRKPNSVQEKEKLLKPDAIEKITISSATYSKEFKVFAVGEYLGREQPQRCLNRWRKIHVK